MRFLTKYLATTAAALSIIAGGAGPAMAVTNSGSGVATPYIAAFAPIFASNGFPRTGTMSLLVRDGSISGTYTGTSVGPDVLDNRMVPVTGSVNEGDRYVQLFIGGAISLRGTMEPDGTISGTATENGRLYEFKAAPAAR